MSALQVRATSTLRAIRRWPASVVGLALTCSVLCAACGKSDSELPSRPVQGPGIPQQRQTNTSTIPTGSTPETARWAASQAQGSLDTRPRFEAPPTVAADQAGSADGEKKQRDFSVELADLLSKNALTCIDSFTPSSRAPVNVQVTAQVMASGTINRAEVSASGLTPAIVACIQKVATTVAMTGPIPDAPRTVSAQFSMTSRAAPEPRQPTAAKDDADDHHDETDQRNENPRDSKIDQVDDHPAEVEQKLYEQTREAPEPPDPVDEPPADNHTDEQP
jgi:hypothetical protein